MKKFSFVFASFVLATAGIANAFNSEAGSGDVAAQDGCYMCKAVIVDGKVVQTCPGGYAGGGDYCKIQGDTCETEGECGV